MTKSTLTTIRLPSEILERAGWLAGLEHGTTSGVLKRAIVIGLRVLDDQSAQIAGNHGERREPVAS